MVWGRYGCQPHDLLAAKSNACGLETSAVCLILAISPTENSKIKLFATIAARGVARTAAEIQDGELCCKS